MKCQKCQKTFSAYDRDGFVFGLAAHFSGISYSCPDCYFFETVLRCTMHDRPIIHLADIGSACIGCVEDKTETLKRDINFSKLHNPEYQPLPGEGVGCLNQPTVPTEERELLLYNLKLRTGGPTIFPFCFLAAIYMLAHGIQETSYLLEEIDTQQSLRGAFPEELFKNPIAPG
jgi:hypothetical protein